MKRNEAKTLKAEQLHKSVCSFSCFLVTKININQLLGAIIRPFVLGWLLLYFLHLPLFFLKGPCVWGGGVIYGCSGRVDTHTRTHTRTFTGWKGSHTACKHDFTALSGMSGVVEKMGTEYKRGKLLDLHIPAATMKTMWQDTFQISSFKTQTQQMVHVETYVPGSYVEMCVFFQDDIKNGMWGSVFQMWFIPVCQKWIHARAVNDGFYGPEHVQRISFCMFYLKHVYIKNLAVH